MIQGAINQLIAYGAAAKKASDIAKAKMEKKQAAESRAMQAQKKALQSARDKINMKFDQKSGYADFLKSLGNNQAPEELKRIAFEASKGTPDVSIGGSKIDISRLSPEAQAAIRGAK